MMQNLSGTIGIRVDPQVIKRLDGLTQRTGLKRITIARQALLLGLKALEEDPRRVIVSLAETVSVESFIDTFMPGPALRPKKRRK